MGTHNLYPCESYYSQLGVTERACDVAALHFDTDLLNSANHRPIGNKNNWIVFAILLTLPSNLVPYANLHQSYISTIPPLLSTRLSVPRLMCSNPD
jgi:hypothetical protein